MKKKKGKTSNSTVQVGLVFFCPGVVWRKFQFRSTERIETHPLLFSCLSFSYAFLGYDTVERCFFCNSVHFFFFFEFYLFFRLSVASTVLSRE